MTDVIRVRQNTNTVVTKQSDHVVKVYDTGVITTGGVSGDYALTTGDTFTGEMTFSGAGNDRTAYFSNASPITTTDRHTVSIYYAGTTGTNNTALNVVSNNTEMSAMWLRGTEVGTGTLKITHDKPAAADTNAAALSISLAGVSSAAQGIFMKPADATYSGKLMQVQNSAGTERLRIDSSGQLMQIAGNTYLGVAGVVQIGSTSTSGATNANGAIGLTDKTAPTGTATGGIVVYSESGILKYRSGTTVYTLDGSATLDADLTAIAALAGTSGLLRKTAANTWSLDTSTFLTSNQSISVTGDATGSGTTSIALTLANSGVTLGTYNDNAAQVRPFTVDAKGRITSIGAAVPIAIAQSAVTNLTTDLGSKAPLASPALTGTPTSTTAAVTTNTTQIATTAFVNAEIANDAVLKSSAAGTAPSKIYVGLTDPGADAGPGDIWIEANLA